MKDDSLSIKLKLVQTNIVQSFLIKGVLHLILNIIQGDQDKTRYHTQGIYHPFGSVVIQTMQQGGGINNREKINEYLAIGTKADGCAV